MQMYKGIDKLAKLNKREGSHTGQPHNRLSDLGTSPNLNQNYKLLLNGDKATKTGLASSAPQTNN